MYRVTAKRPNGDKFDEKTNSIEMANLLFLRAQSENCSQIIVKDHKQRQFSEADISRIIHDRAPASTATWLNIDSGSPHQALYLTASAQYLSAAQELENNEGPFIVDQSPQYFLYSTLLNLL